LIKLTAGERRRKRKGEIECVCERERQRMFVYFKRNIYVKRERLCVSFMRKREVVKEKERERDL